MQGRFLAKQQLLAKRFAGKRLPAKRFATEGGSASLTGPHLRIASLASLEAGGSAPRSPTQPALAGRVRVRGCINLCCEASTTKGWCWVGGAIACFAGPPAPFRFVYSTRRQLLR